MTVTKVVADESLLTRARVKLVLEHPFLGRLVLHLPAVPGPSPVGTAHVDGERLVYEPEFVRKLSDDERQGLVAHEVLHMALGHCFPWRRGNRRPEKWTVACDFVVNLIVKDCGLKLPEGGLLDEKFRNMSVERVYDLLPDGPKMKALDVVIDIKAPPGKGEKGGKDGKDGKGEGEGHDKDGKCCGGHEINKGFTKDEQRKMSQKWQGILVQAATLAKQRGKLPGSLNFLVKQMLRPKVRWQDVVDRFVTEVIKDDYDFSRPDRRFLGGMAVVRPDGSIDYNQAICLPDLTGEGCQVAVAVDTSGSIDDKTLVAFASECVAILRTRNVTRVRLMACDARVHLDRILEKSDAVPTEFGGRGGTDFRPVFDLLQDGKFKPACLLYLTDMYGPFPDVPPEYPVLWVTVSRDVKAPFGMTIKYTA